MLLFSSFGHNTTSFSNFKTYFLAVSMLLFHFFLLVLLCDSWCFFCSCIVWWCVFLSVLLCPFFKCLSWSVLLCVLNIYTYVSFCWMLLIYLLLFFQIYPTFSSYYAIPCPWFFVCLCVPVCWSALYVSEICAPSCQLYPPQVYPPLTSCYAIVCPPFFVSLWVPVCCCAK